MQTNNTQAALSFDTVDIDVSRFVKFERAPSKARFQVNGEGGRYSGAIGACIGTICLKHSNGYEVVLQFEDGAIDTFNPYSLFPAPTG